MFVYQLIKFISSSLYFQVEYTYRHYFLYWVRKSDHLWKERTKWEWNERTASPRRRCFLAFQQVFRSPSRDCAFLRSGDIIHFVNGVLTHKKIMARHVIASRILIHEILNCYSNYIIYITSSVIFWNIQNEFTKHRLRKMCKVHKSACGSLIL